MCSSDLRDCAGRAVKVPRDPWEMCFYFHTLHAFWIIGWSPNLHGLKKIFGSGERKQIGFIVFSESVLVEQRHDQNSEHYGVGLVHVSNGVIITELKNCTFRQESVGFCKKELDEMNLVLEGATVRWRVRREWILYNDSLKYCPSLVHPVYIGLTSYLDAVSNLTSTSYTGELDNYLNPFKPPENLSLEQIITYITIHGIQLEMMDPRCVVNLGPYELGLYYHSNSIFPGSLHLVLTETEDWYVASCDGIYVHVSSDFFLDQIGRAHV